MTAGGTDLASWMRGRLHQSGVDGDTPLCTALDVVMTLVVDAPVDALRKWRTELDAALWRIRPPDRDTWGLLPEQQQAMARAAGMDVASGAFRTTAAR